MDRGNFLPMNKKTAYKLMMIIFFGFIAIWWWAKFVDYIFPKN